MIALKIDGRAPKQIRNKLFKFEAMWLMDPRCDDVVTKSWQIGLNKVGRAQFTNCMDQCTERLWHWNKMEFGHVGSKVGPTFSASK